MTTQFQMMPLPEALPWMNQPTDKDLVIRLNIAYVKEEGDEDGEEDEDEEYQDDCDKVYACRTKWLETDQDVISILITRNDTVAFMLEVAYELPNKVLLGKGNVQEDLVLFFLDEEDEMGMQSLAYRMLHAIEDISAIPYFPPPDKKPEEEAQ